MIRRKTLFGGERTFFPEPFFGKTEERWELSAPKPLTRAVTAMDPRLRK